MSYIVPMDKPTECRRCPFCDPYGYDCRLQRESDEKSFQEQIAGCPLTDISPLTDPEQRIFLAAMGREEKLTGTICMSRMWTASWRCADPYEEK